MRYVFQRVALSAFYHGGRRARRALNKAKQEADAFIARMQSRMPYGPDGGADDETQDDATCGRCTRRRRTKGRGAVAMPVPQGVRVRSGVQLRGGRVPEPDAYWRKRRSAPCGCCCRTRRRARVFISCGGCARNTVCVRRSPPKRSPASSARKTCIRRRGV